MKISMGNQRRFGRIEVGIVSAGEPLTERLERIPSDRFGVAVCGQALSRDGLD
jgi:hypothetical protein